MDGLSPYRFAFLTALERALAVYSYDLREMTAGCGECATAWEWPVHRLQRYLLAWQLVDAAIQISGERPTITSAYRCKPCNVRRSGADLSRHLAGEAGGKDYAAFDVEWQSWEPVYRILDWVERNGGKSAFGDLLREWTGVRAGAGVIFYQRQPRLHLDVRTYDWLKIESGVRRSA